MVPLGPKPAKPHPVISACMQRFGFGPHQHSAVNSHKQHSMRIELPLCSQGGAEQISLALRTRTDAEEISVSLTLPLERLDELNSRRSVSCPRAETEQKEVFY